MIENKAQGYQEGLLIYQMLDELAYNLGYENGAQDLVGEEPAVNMELMQIVMEKLQMAKEQRLLQARLQLEAAQRELELAQAEINVAYQ